MTLTLHYAPDNASLVVRLALEELGLPYQTRLIDRRSKEQHSEAYRQINPLGLIPALETPEGTLFETAAILLWLADRDGALIPAAPLRGQALKWLMALSNGYHTALRHLFYPGTYGPGAEDVIKATARDTLSRYLAIFEEAQAEPVWTDPGIHHLYLACCLRWTGVYGNYPEPWFDLGTYPALHALAQKMETRPAAQRSADAEGLGSTPFSAPRFPKPPEGHPF